MGKIFAVTSGKGGTGKSTVSSGLAFSFASSGKRVLLIDLDEGLRCLDLMLGIEDNLVFDLSDILAGRSVDDATYSVPHTERLYLIPAPQKTGALDPVLFSGLLKQLMNNYDIILLDLPAGLNLALYEAMPREIRYIAVCNPDPVSVRDAAVICDNLPQVNTPPVLILNKFSYDLMRDVLYQNIDDIIDASGFRLLGIVPNSEELMLLSITHRLKRRSSAFRAFTRIAKRLDGEQIRLPNLRKI